MEIINVRLPDKLALDIDNLAKKHNLTRSEVMRQALTIYLHLVENMRHNAKTHDIPSQTSPDQLYT